MKLPEMVMISQMKKMNKISFKTFWLTCDSRQILKKLKKEDLKRKLAFRKKNLNVQELEHYQLTYLQLQPCNNSLWIMELQKEKEEDLKEARVNTVLSRSRVFNLLVKPHLNLILKVTTKMMKKTMMLNMSQLGKDKKLSLIVKQRLPVLQH